MDKQSLKPIIEKLENLFSKFNDKFYNGELQQPIITVSPDMTKGAYGWCTGWKAWHIEAEQETDKKNSSDEGYYEINMCAEYLSRPFENIAETLLHEMVHLYNLQIGVQDTSRGGTYHNKKYKESAEAHGLTVEKTKSGWNKTALNAEAKEFVDGLKDKKFKLFRERGFKLDAGKAASKQSTRKYVCPECGCIIRATKEVRVICGDCNVEFVEAE